MNIDTERLKRDLAYWDEVAPDGATYYVVNSTFPWEKRILDNWYYLDTDNNEWTFLTASGEARLNEDSGRLPMISRPEPATEWDAWGFPKVGTECECSYKDEHGEWSELIHSKPLYIDHVGMLMQRLDETSDDDRCFFHWNEMKTQPIRTKAERERDELECLLKRWHGCTIDTIAEAIISSGWKKETSQ